jgi:6,7-dimethyl-8-ribityllumazine synthase
MATSLKNLSEYNPKEIPSAQGLRFGIVVAEYNYDITGALLQGAVNTLLKHGVIDEDILVEHVPGSFELPKGAQYLAEYTDIDSVICLGCVIQGETKHFDYICDSVTQGITQLNLDYPFPFVFGVLTTNNLQQAKDRAGGKHGNKGDEAAVTAIRMVAMWTKLEFEGEGLE